MKDLDFVPYEQALALKELGFDEPCFMFYEQDTNSKFLQKRIDDDYWGDYTEPRDWNSIPNKPWKPFCQCISAPTFSQAFRWFREKYYLDSWVYCSDESKGYFAIIVSCKRLVFYNENKETYEEAELACLNKLLEITKNKQS